MSSQSTIAHVIVGKVPPKEHIEAIRKAYPKAFGFACQHEGKLVVHNDEQTWAMTDDNILELLTGTKDDGHRLLFFSKYDKFEPEDIQPWSLLTTEGAPMMAMCYEGDFSKYDGLDGNHTAEFCALKEVIGSKISAVLDDDVTKVIEAMKAEKFRKVLNLMHSGRAWFSFLPVKGSPFSFGQNDKSKGFDWGQVSNGDGIEIAEKKPEPTTVKASGNPLDFLSTKKASSQTPSVPAQPSGPVANPVPEPVPGPERIAEDAVKDMQTGIVWVRMQVPKKLDASAKNFWIRLFHTKNCKAFTDGDGTLEGVDHLKSEVYVPVHPSLLEFAKRDVKNNRDVKQLYDDIKKARDAGKIKDFPAAASAGKTENLSRSAMREGAYDMTEKDMEECMTIMAEYLGDNSKKRPSPDELRAADSKKPTFSEKIGVSFAELLFTPNETYFKMFGGNKRAVECVRELITELTKHVKLEDLAGTLKPADKQVEVPSTQPVSVPAKKSGNPLDFLSNKVA